MTRTAVNESVLNQKLAQDVAKRKPLSPDGERAMSADTGSAALRWRPTAAAACCHRIAPAEGPRARRRPSCVQHWLLMSEDPWIVLEWMEQALAALLDQHVGVQSADQHSCGVRACLQLSSGCGTLSVLCIGVGRQRPWPCAQTQVLACCVMVNAIN